MDRKEMESLVQQLKAAGLNDEQIMETFFDTFKDGKMDRKDLEACAEFMGYELTDDFKNDTTQDPINGADSTNVDGVSKEEAESMKEIKEGQTPQEFQKEIEDSKKESPDTEMDDEKEWEEVQKKFKW